MGLNAAGIGSTLGPVGAGMTQGGLSSGATQGLGVATGLQHSFDWTGMAASSIAQGVGRGVGLTSLGKTDGVGQVVSGLAGGAASTLVRGEVSNGMQRKSPETRSVRW
jgi:hypothetical protein